MPAAFEFRKLLSILVVHEVDFIVVGGIAAILHGSPLMTRDLDLVYSTSPENITRLLTLLAPLDTLYRDPAGRRITPTREKLETLRFNLLQTRLGHLDLLQEVAGRRYSDLLESTVRFEIDDFEIRALDLAMLIETKEAANRPKDHNALLYLRRLVALEDKGGP